MLARIRTSALSGVEARPVDVEVRVSDTGERSMIIIGLGDGAVRESRDRVLSAIRHSGFKVPKKILVNLAPAELRKEGASFDLPIALALLAASRQLDNVPPATTHFHGELSLDGKVKAVRGVVALAVQCVQAGGKELVVPAPNLAEARLIAGIASVGVESLVELIQYLKGSSIPDRLECAPAPKAHPCRCLSDVWGQERAKRALLIAAAGGHNLLMIGPPGCGKSMLAERFPRLLPPLRGDELLESVKIHSIAGLPLQGILAGERPFRAPHHLTSDAGLIGGGPSPRPGELSLAHHGVLFLDEFPEYRRSAIEALRAPLESGRVVISRARGSVEYPARVQLLAAMNPCPCGRLGSDVGAQSAESRAMVCRCSRTAVYAYLKKLSQPILDRIDLHVELDAVPLHAMTSATTGTDDQLMVAAVVCARGIQHDRGGVINAHLAGQNLAAVLRPRPAALALLERACERSAISARGFMRILRVARTIADLDAAAEIAEHHVAEAVSFRSLERLERYCRGDC